MKINILGNKEVEITEQQYLLTEDTNKLVLKNATLMSLCKSAGLPNPTFEFVENARAFQSDKFSYVVIAKVKVGDREYEEVGEANHLNCQNDIAKAHPATMAKTRGISRVLIAALGLQGVAYSEDEFDKKNLKKASKNTNTTVNSTEPLKDQKSKDTESKSTKTQTSEMSKEQAGEVIVNVGYMKGKKVKELQKKNGEWLLNLKGDFEELKKGVKIYFDL